MSWQPIIASLFVIAAAAWLVRHAVRKISGYRRGEAGGCSACPKNTQTTKPTPLVQLGEKSDDR